MSVSLIRAGARGLPLADESVDLVITSPPYFAQRSYQDAGTHYAGQIGSEDNPHHYLDALVAATAEMARVLKPTGSIWVNLGDKYCSPGGHTDNTASSRLEGRRAQRRQGRADRATTGHGIKAKSLMGLPWRYAIRCIDELGLILRRDQIWEKTNPMPESCTDRTRTDHEYWFHFTLHPRYFSAIDELREPASGYQRAPASRTTPMGQRQRAMTDACNPLGRLPGSVWAIATQPLLPPAGIGVDHFAAFPMEWPRRIIRGWSPGGICTVCNEGRRPVVHRPGLLGGDNNPDSRNGTRTRSTLDGGRDEWARRVSAPDYIAGSTCLCPEPTAPIRPAVVLDPFGGTGTTALVADALGRHGISADMSADYCRLARWRTTDPAQRAAAMQVDKPDPVPDGMDSLLDLIQDGAA